MRMNANDLIVYNSKKEYKKMLKTELLKVIESVRKIFPKNDIIYISGNEEVYNISEEKMNAMGWFKDKSMEKPFQKPANIMEAIEQIEIECYMEEKVIGTINALVKDIKGEMPEYDVRARIIVLIKKKGLK